MDALMEIAGLVVDEVEALMVRRALLVSALDVDKQVRPDGIWFPAVLSCGMRSEEAFEQLREIGDLLEALDPDGSICDG